MKIKYPDEWYNSSFWHSVPSDKFSVADVLQGLSATEGSPDYSVALQWMKGIPNPAVSYDIWARGSYTLRLAEQRRQNINPLYINVNSVAEMQWTYRRLALLGVPLEFVFHSSLSPPAKVFHLHPANPNDTFGHGWGYVAALGEPVRIGERQWATIVGRGQYLSNDILEWIMHEGADAFQSGDLFVSPAEHVGLSSFGGASGHPLAEITGGAVAGEVASDAALLLNLELPILDKMKPRHFSTFLREHGNELERFRTAFSRLKIASGDANMEEACREIRYEVAEICLSQRYQALRSTALKLGGVVTSSAAVVGATFATAPAAIVPVAAAAGIGAAAQILCSLRDALVSASYDRQKNPYFVAFKLGLDSPSKVPKRVISSKWRPMLYRERIGPEGLSDYHWLTPATPGIKFLAVRKRKDKVSEGATD